MPCHILDPTESNITTIVARLQAFEPVALPTETVYGLATNALSDSAVAGIYALKKRPAFNPLIAHCASLAQAEEHVYFNATAHTLAQAFWPGPLTLVLPKKPESKISPLVTAGLETLAIRVPNHVGIQSVLQKINFPLVAPSANPSESISPTNARDVVNAFHGIDYNLLVLDGGPCPIGLESTIVRVDDNQVEILRPGAITPQEIEAVSGKGVITKSTDAILAPGQLKKHYAPSIPVRINVTSLRPGEALLSFGNNTLPGASHELNLSGKGDLQEAAANLFKFLRALDNPKYTSIGVVSIPNEGIGLAINDRLKRASE